MPSQHSGLLAWRRSCDSPSAVSAQHFGAATRCGLFIAGTFYGVVDAVRVVASAALLAWRCSGIVAQTNSESRCAPAVASQGTMQRHNRALVAGHSRHTGTHHVSAAGTSGRRCHRAALL